MKQASRDLSVLPSDSRAPFLGAAVGAVSGHMERTGAGAGAAMLPRAQVQSGTHTDTSAFYPKD